jgi:hypothetical protein
MYAAIVRPFMTASFGATDAIAASDIDAFGAKGQGL